MRIELKRINDAFLMEATNPDGNTTRIDTLVSEGGSNSAMRPMQLMLVSTASCSTIDVISILNKMRQPLEDIRITIDGERERNEKPPNLYTKVHMHYYLTGNLDADKVERAIELSVGTYCSASRTLEKAGAKVTWSYEILPSTKD